MKNSDKDLINKTRKEAEAILKEEGTEFRIDFLEGTFQKKDLVYNVDRVNLAIQDGKVIATSRG